MTEFYLATLALHLHRFIKKELSDYPVDAIRMDVCFLYSYVDINFNIFAERNYFLVFLRVFKRVFCSVFEFLIGFVRLFLWVL
jgi:hypothetical protein